VRSGSRAPGRPVGFSLLDRAIDQSCESVDKCASRGDTVFRRSAGHQAAESYIQVVMMMRWYVTNDTMP
jgi:hypothetical protein